MKSHRQRFATALAGAGLIASLFLAGAAVAGPGGGGGHGGAHHAQRLEKMQAELGLSAEQVSRIKAIFESSRAEMQASRQQMKSILTAEQQAQMQTWRQNRQPGQRPSREGMQQKWEQLGLTDAQREQMRTHREQMKARRDSIKSQVQAILTPDQQAKWEAKKAEFRRERGNKDRRGDNNNNSSNS